MKNRGGSAFPTSTEQTGLTVWDVFFAAALGLTSDHDDVLELEHYVDDAEKIADMAMERRKKK